MIGLSLKNGLFRVGRLPLLMSLFFLYQLLWGVILYRVVKSVMIPILFRLPDKQTAPELFHFFLIESQIKLLKTDVAIPALMIASTLIVLRLVITPMLNAGLYYTIQNGESDKPQLTLFAEGIRKHSLAYFFIHAAQWTMMLLPIVLFVPVASKEELLQLVASIVQSSNETILVAILTSVLLYFALIRLIVMYVCFGRLEQRSVFKSLARWGRHALPTALITIGMLIVYALAFSTLSAMTLKMAGFTALLVYFGGYAIRLLFKCWEVSTLGHYYTSETKQRT